MSNEVCNDLMVDIFERLPLKSIVRLRSLSKYWHSRIASPEFVRDYNLRRCSKNPQKVLIRHLTYCGNYEFKDIYTLHDGDQLPLDPGSGYTGIPGVEFPHGTKEVVGSYNGILCMRDNSNNISLWNISIRRQLIVSRYPSSEKYPDQVVFGFGFDPITYDYKIVAISYSRYNKLDENNTFIYSLKTDSWSAIPSPSSRFYNVKSKACFFNGILHWVADGYVTEPKDHLSRFILTLSLISCV